MIKRFTLFIISLLISGVASAQPEWVQEVIRAVPVDRKVTTDSDTLLMETRVSWDAKGLRAERHRHIIRVLKAAGAKAGTWAVTVNGKTEQFREGESGLLRDGKLLPLSPRPKWKKGPVPDTDQSTDQVYHDINYSGFTKPGDILYAEWTTLEPAHFAEWSYEWTDGAPVWRERVEVEAPAGWKMSSRFEGPSQIEGRDLGPNVRRWDFSSLKSQKKEDFSDPAENLIGHLIVSVTPPSPIAGAAFLQFATWDELGAWARSVWDGLGVPDPELRNKAATLLQGGPSTGFEALRPLARHVREIPYISVIRGLGIGLGYQPHAAATVLKQRWGDCKDKSNCFIALAGVTQNRVLPVIARIHADEPFLPSWPSPQQFNHAITAIQVDDTVDLPGVITTSHFGRVLLFDTTDNLTPFGAFSASLYGQPIAILGENKTEVLMIPYQDSVERNSVTQNALIVLDASGSLEAEGTLEQRGEGTTEWRAMAKYGDEARNRELFQGMLNRSLRDSRLESFEFLDGSTLDAFGMKFRWKADQTGQRLADGSWLVRLEVFGANAIPLFPDTDRKGRLILPARGLNQEITLKLPKGWKVAEKPADAQFEAAFGSYAIQWSVVANEVTVKRQLSLKRSIVPLDQYAALRTFLQKVRRAHASAVLLSRAEPSGP